MKKWISLLMFLFIFLIAMAISAAILKAAPKAKEQLRRDQVDGLNSFLRLYCQTYESKDIDKFATFFDLDALENNKPFHEVLPTYRKNMEMIESLNYRIDLISYSSRTHTGDIRVKGKYYTQYQLHEGTWKENNGNITMELIKSGDSYLVKRLDYTSQSEKTMEKQPKWEPWIEIKDKKEQVAPYTFSEEGNPAQILNNILIKIPERTVVPLTLIQNLKGSGVLVGSSVDFRVTRNIIIDEYIVIKSGAPAYGSVTSAEEAGYVSTGGKIGLSIDYCKAVDGKKVYLKSILEYKGKSSTGANIAASIIICPLILLAKGEEAEIPLGTEFKSYTESDVDVKVTVKDKLSREDLNQIEIREREEREKKEKERQEEIKRKEKETREKELREDER
jgi:hypothetical protein